ncbi:MAG TPA: methylated-DNA--[protein]-cysteine S-methyltransferase [Opitutaceae bacterium]|nr:methylated-DNA--[protein]-cysteine S-methyltransferase [Opitutaceae bacterium]
MKYAYKQFPSPVGELRLVASDDSLVAILWENDEPARVPWFVRKEAFESREHPVLWEAERQLAEYFAGERTTFALKLAFIGTEFQQQVWRALTEIPFGQTLSYAQLAAQLGRPAAVRAVGAANGRNPISIIAPCHRVIGSNGSLTGFAGGLEAKSFLLNLEAKSRLERKSEFEGEFQLEGKIQLEGKGRLEEEPKLAGKPKLERKLQLEANPKPERQRTFSEMPIDSHCVSGTFTPPHLLQGGAAW